MGIITILLIAFGLSFDTFAVSVSSGLILRRINFFNAMKIAFVLAFFQGLMPMIGWLIGSGLKKYMMAYDHWIAFVLLSILGAKMIYESFQSEEERKPINPMRFVVMVSMAVATSIDALIVGLSFAFFEINISHCISDWGRHIYRIDAGNFIWKKSGSPPGAKDGDYWRTYTNCNRSKDSDRASISFVRK